MGPNGKRMVEVNKAINQTDTGLVEGLSDADHIAYLGHYARLYGSGLLPPLDEDPTANQLVCLRALLNEGRAPYVDFAIWGPYGGRTEKKLSLAGPVHQT